MALKDFVEYVRGVKLNAEAKGAVLEAIVLPISAEKIICSAVWANDEAWECLRTNTRGRWLIHNVPVIWTKRYLQDNKAWFRYRGGKK